MSAVTARPVLRAESAGGDLPARIVVLVVVGATVVLAAALLATSLVPSATLAGRLMGAAGEARSGAFTQDLIAHLGERTRFEAFVLLALAAGLMVARGGLEDLVASCLETTALRIRWPSRRELVAVGLPALVAVALRAAFLSQPMRYDEALSFNEFASRPLYYGLSFYPDPNNHLLNTLLVHLAYLGLGNQPWVLRLPALLGGVLLVPATYALARLLYGRQAAVLAATLAAVSSYLVEYSTNSRGYTLQVLCFVVLMTLAIAAVRRDARSALVLAALVAAVGAYAVPTMLYGVAIAASSFVVEMRRRGQANIGAAHLGASAPLLALAVALLYLPVIVVSGPDKLVANRFVVPLGASELANELPRSIAQTWAFWNRDVPLPAGAALVVGFVIATAAELRNRRIPLGLLAPTVCLVLVVLQRVAPFERVWLFLLPLYFAVASGGLARFVDGRLLGIAFGAVLAFTTLTSGSILRSGETGAFPDAEAVARSLVGRLAPHDAVLTQMPASLPELQYYFPRVGLPIDVLVRSPDKAAHIYAIVPPGVTPRIDGWNEPHLIEHYTGSDLLAFER